MTTNKKELAVAALQNGTVIDHIPSSMLFKAVKILGIEKLQTHITIGNNLESSKLGTKGIIKVADVLFPEAILNRIALIAPSAKVNIIRDFEVVEKHRVSLPETIVGIVKCNNPKCITNNEPMKTRFEVVDNDDVTIRCHYCGHTVKSSEAIID
ncbi:MAG: aspartate carbamoyltransferase regulatory subunit [Muribaculaceae bacterium]|nr:aspartate carbamoyltransferase regulatory subunit [Muribaculaceae bacterium]MBR1964739.1 aspartate carbamoyltransferase regulatory subunit [Muribaculaceae bacterium]